MKTLYLTITLFIFTTLALLPNSFAQDVEPPAYMVRLIYLLPKDREAQPDIDTKLNVLIKETQQLFANEMERHGYGRKTFRFEADENGDAIVHHIKSYQDDKYFHRWNIAYEAIHDYFGVSFDLDKYIFLVLVDVSTEQVAGKCGWWTGVATIPASGPCLNVSVAAHEIGHGFRLTHNFNDDTYIMSYGGVRNSLSACAAEWLDVHPFFNPDKVVTHNNNTSINLLSSTFDETPPYALRLRFEITDPDGLHQVQLITNDKSIGFSQYVECRSLSGTSNIVEFVSTGVLDVATLNVIDKTGNYMIYQYFDISNIIPPGSEAVFIPDANLDASIREVLGYGSEEQITKFDMSRFRELRAGFRDIKDLTGLQYAVALRHLYVANNQIEDITPLTKLTNLKVLDMGNNQINDITPLTELTDLRYLDLRRNQINDITPLAGLTNLELLYLHSNNPNKVNDITSLMDMANLRVLDMTNHQINDITPLTGLTNLESLHLTGNQINDITPLTGLTNLENLHISHNPISDISLLTKFTQLKNLSFGGMPIKDTTFLNELTELETLSLYNCQITEIGPIARLTQLQVLEIQDNQINDVSPLANLLNLNRLSLEGNPIKDRGPLFTLLRKNPDIKIYLKYGGDPLPVTLSDFQAKYTDTGVILKWTTESELNNAGFYIYRSETKDGEFKVINPTLIQGAGTTGERNTYTWTDTTAKPRTFYYYRIEDVSHAGVREQLATVRLRGLVSAKGKLTTKWGDLKRQE